MLQVHLVRVTEAFPAGPPDDSRAPHTSLDELLELVDPQKRSDVAGFRFLRDAQRCLLGRLLARHVATVRLDTEWSRLTFARTERGRPYLTEPSLLASTFDYNVSHDSDLVAVASLASSTLPQCRVGIDIMRIRNPWDGTNPSEFIDGIAEQLTSGELVRIRTEPDDEARLKHALALWTLKEAYVKATGDGLHLDLSRLDFAVNLQDSGGTAQLDGRSLAGWRFHLVFLREEGEPYCLAVAEQAEVEQGEIHVCREGPTWVQTVGLQQIKQRAQQS
ncbi:holo-[acyl-carrier-protein] synthase [Rhodotorula paludigena]|uniref:holo-[acyl-carrier-protein] synthase n=1 Tax=Rhodotorula paludigena TaxID=86838 RepID=UPI00317DD044